jgi:hypothetical protein
VRRKPTLELGWFRPYPTAPRQNLLRPIHRFQIQSGDRIFAHSQASGSASYFFPMASLVVQHQFEDAAQGIHLSRQGIANFLADGDFSQHIGHPYRGSRPWPKGVPGGKGRSQIPPGPRRAQKFAEWRGNRRQACRRPRKPRLQETPICACHAPQQRKSVRNRVHFHHQGECRGIQITQQNHHPVLRKHGGETANQKVARAIYEGAAAGRQPFDSEKQNAVSTVEAEARSACVAS